MRATNYVMAGCLYLTGCTQAPISPSANELARASAGSPDAIEKVKSASDYNSSLGVASTAHRHDETLSGVVMLRQKPTVPLTGVRLILKKKDDEKWTTITTLISDENGEFTFSPSLDEGTYWLGARGGKYKGGTSFSLKKDERKRLEIWVTPSGT